MAPTSLTLAPAPADDLVIYVWRAIIDIFLREIRCVSLALLLGFGGLIPGAVRRPPADPAAHSTSPAREPSSSSLGRITIRCAGSWDELTGE